MSLVDLRDACGDQLLEEAEDGLRALADQFGYDIVGVPATKNDEALFDEYRQGSCGSLRQREWENSGIKFKPPAKESDHCFFVANASAPDQEQEPRFVWRSAATLRVELKGMRVATTKKIRAEREARAKANGDAIDVDQAVELVIELKSEAQNQDIPAAPQLRSVQSISDFRFVNLLVSAFGVIVV